MVRPAGGRFACLLYSFLPLSDDVVVYVKNSAGTKYEPGTTSDINGASAVEFYDVVGDGRVFPNCSISSKR
ncbi:hypothetical protein MASR2M70_05940 [Bacillota bacterium]